MSRAEKGAFTLLETLLCSVLALLLLGLCIMVLVPMGRGAARGADEVELRQMAAVALDKLGADLNQTTPAGVSLASGGASPWPVLLAVHPLANLTADGSQSFASQLVVYAYNSATQRLTRKTWPPLPPSLSQLPSTSQATRYLPSDLLQIASQTNGSEATLAGWVQSFQVNLNGLEVDLSLTVQRAGLGPNGQESYTLNYSQYLRNN